MSTKIHIFDVEHGACDVIQTNNGKLLMIDCGHNSSTNWRPSDWINNNKLKIDNLSIANIDEDHVTDLENVIDKCNPSTFKTNWNLTSEWIEKRKKETGGIGNGVKKLIESMRNKYTVDGITFDYGLNRERFCHSTDKFNDFNNLSLVNFFEYSNIGILFPGDIEKEAWEEFLKNQNFKNCLKKTNILLASHHGRENGYCEEIFNYCKPDIIIISDKAIQHETQMKNQYAKHANGIYFGQDKRFVLTTRKDKKITIEINENSNYTVYTSS